MFTGTLCIDPQVWALETIRKFLNLFLEYNFCIFFLTVELKDDKVDVKYDFDLIQQIFDSDLRVEEPMLYSH